ncbi:CBS domain-containing protein [Halosolutus gelatinilyticus]|uniref:CBS domain-containing protein n=1 Tax=Halosolutus gelatinilyticus TaxID=2931975 RepID=UPI001FF692AA|nr:CBS domain-containing protein [Halosolutus gelatinilyticus]
MGSELSVREVLTTEFVGASESDSVLGAVRLMREEQTSSVVVLRGSEPIGVMTEWDVLGLVADEGDPAETPVAEVMTSPVVSVSPDRSLADVATTMARENVRNIVVEDEDELLGVVTQRDVITAAGSLQATPSPAQGIDRSIEDERPVEGTNARPAVEEPQLLPNGGDEYSTQGVCEACGSLADSLWDANGQLVCSDCRSV